MLHREALPPGALGLLTALCAHPALAAWIVAQPSWLRGQAGSLPHLLLRAAYRPRKKWEKI